MTLLSHTPPMRFQLYLLFLLFSHIFIFSSPFIVSARCLEYQKNALLQIFSNHSALRSWTSDGSDCCFWEGVTCDATGLVISLDLTNRSISGRINSPILSSLYSLQILNLSYNNFNSPIPINLDSLSNLTHLNLSNSGFTGQIPLAISHMRNLVSLDISTFFLRKPLTSLKLEDPSIEKLLRNLSGMTKLHLDGVNISSEVPEFLSDFTNLTCLRLSSCRLQGEFPAEIFQLPKLEILDVSGNPFLNGSFPAELPRENALQTLVLTNARFSGELPHSFGNLRRLKRLQISGCKFSGRIPPSVRNISGIVHLDLSSNGFNGSIPSLDNLTKLTYLDLSMNNFSGAIPSLESLTELVLLDLSANAFSGPIPALDSLRNVTEIVLSSNNLNGTIPKSFGDGLHKLKLLDLRSNSLHGKIPSSLFALPSLQTLKLSQNQLNGQLAELGNASSTVETVDLSDNQLQGQIPQSLFNLLGLKVLDLSSNKFNGTVQLAMLGILHQLSDFDLSDNGLSVNTNAPIDSFPQLGRLRLGSCNLTEFPGFLKNQSKMVYLDLSHNNIDGKIPKWVWEIGNGSLTYLNLSQNWLTGLEQPHNLSSIKKLRILDLHSNRLQGSIPLPPPSIIVLDYSNNIFTSGIPSNFTNSLNFTIFFSISGNKIIGEIPPSICNATYLQVLDISNNDLNGRIPKCLLVISNVISILNLRNNSFTGNIPEVSSVSCRLRTLDLNGNRLEGQLPKSLASCSELEVLDVGNNRLNGTFPHHWDTLSKLRVLVLLSNNFSGSISQSLNVSFPVLQIIDLSSNGFSGNLPNCFRNLNAMVYGEKDEDSYHQIIRYGFLNLTKLYYQDTVMVTSKGLDLELVKILTIFTSVDLSNNNFKGEIPEVIGDLNLLRMLNLSRNWLTGQIPASIGNLRQLESLDLSKNNLSGEIPLQLLKLTFLSVLNLSCNQLVGSIPQDRQFLTFSNDSFTGNSGLCGQPLSRKCVPNPPPPLVVEAADSSASKIDWELIFIGLGFGGGMGMIAGPFMFWTKGRRWYNKHVDRVVLMIFPSCAFYYLDCEEPRIEAEEQVDQDCTENTTDWDGEEEECHQRFCVFCTQVDSRWERVMHKECSCLDLSPQFSSPQSQIPEATAD